MSTHLHHVRDDAQYAEFLANWDAGFYAKYADSLRPESGSGRVLDVGCGVGQVVARLCQSGIEAHGADVSEANIARASQVTPRCILYDGQSLPYEAGWFDVVGALNVLEHVEEPEAFIGELARVTRPGGRIVLSSPNFLRALGWRDYHPRMRGLASKWRNFRGLLARLRQIRTAPDKVRFERMAPIIRQPFQPDDDAIVVTNPIEMTFFLRRAGCEILSVECTDRYVPRVVDFILNATPLRYAMFNSFVVARRR